MEYWEYWGTRRTFAANYFLEVGVKVLKHNPIAINFKIRSFTEFILSRAEGFRMTTPQVSF